MAYGGHDFDLHIERIARRVSAQRRNLKIGYVTSYDPDNYAVRLRLEPESTANEANGLPVVETNWMPIYRGYGGNGWGMVAVPNANPNPPYGDMAVALWIDGGDHGVALVGIPNDVERQFTGAVPAGATSPISGLGLPSVSELVFVHPTGASVKLMRDGSVRLRTSDGSSLTMGGTGTLVLASSGGAGITIGSGTPGSLGTTGAANNALVTKADLQDAIDNLILSIRLTCKTGNDATPIPVNAKASTTITGAD